MRITITLGGGLTNESDVEYCYVVLEVEAAKLENYLLAVRFNFSLLAKLKVSLALFTFRTDLS